MAGGASPTRLVAFFLCVAATLHLTASEKTEARMLLKFKASLTDDVGSLDDWTSGPSNAGPCLGGRRGNWTGVYCEDGVVIKLVLEGMRLGGAVEIEALADLSGLRSLSLMNNSLEGPLPAMGKLGNLRSVYLANNKLSGEIDDDAFAGMGALRVVHLENNAFAGPIPSSLAQAPKLIELALQNNEFSGTLPDFRQRGQFSLNVSYNRLEGQIPASISTKNKRTFVGEFYGNNGLCGAPLDVACETATPERSSTPMLIAVVVAAAVVIFVILGGIFAALKRRQHEQQQEQLGRPASRKCTVAEADHIEQGSLSGSSTGSSRKKKAAAAREAEQNLKLVFVREDRERFELQDLLRASAEVLGSGGFGSSYKAMLLIGQTMVVKRFREMNGVGKEEFREHMRRLGSLSHPNLLPLVAYYYRKEEKLLVTDHMPNGSLAHLLHAGNRSQDQPKPDWPTRLRIIKGVARGLLYLYNELPMLATPHGHLKSSNVLLDDALEPLITDYALSPVMNPAHASDVMVAYRSPEYEQQGRTTKKSDVWSLGIMILEVLTGRFPDNCVRRRRGMGSSNGGSNGSGGDLAGWVNSVAKEEWTGEVFDGGMGGTEGGEREMLRLLRIGLACCENDVRRRWEMAEAVARIDEVKERNGVNEDGSSSSHGGGGDAYASPPATEGGNFFADNV